jgi:hypothetical protein
MPVVSLLPEHSTGVACSRLFQAAGAVSCPGEMRRANCARAVPGRSPCSRRRDGELQSRPR